MTFSSRQISAMIRDPMRAATGRVPRELRINPPLAVLLSAIPPRHRMLFRGVTVGPELGYQGQRTFATAHQALAWVKPQERMLETDPWPAESWRIKSRGCQRITIQALARNCADSEGAMRSLPPAVEARLKALGMWEGG